MGAILVAVHFPFGLNRQKREREAEVRALSGAYLSDGKEIVRIKMPELFEAPPAQTSPRNLATSEGLPVEMQVSAFLAAAPAQLDEIRKALQELGRSSGEGHRQRALVQMQLIISALKSQSDCWDLRPFWQMSSALELLLKHLAENAKGATPSTIRTMARAVDMLSEVSVRGVRPDLITSPPVSILAVDDDPLCLRAVSFALQKAEMTPQLASDGERAVALCAQNYYDVIFMDIQMPNMDGLTACDELHKTKKNERTPVVFVTGHFDFHTRTQSTLKSATEWMGKPFLTFEITVKALTLAMRKRLDLAAGEREMAPAQANPVLAPSAPTVASAAVSSVPVEPAPGRPAKAATAAASVETLPTGDTRWAGEFFGSAPEYLAATRNILKDLRDASSQCDPLGTLFLRVHTFVTRVSEAQLPVATRVSSALEGLIQRLHRNPKMVTASTVNTVSHTLKLLEHLCVPGREKALANFPPVRILVVDDEPLARQAVMGALQPAFEKPETAADGAKAAALVAEKQYDVIFTDVEMPAMDGFELCASIRSSAVNATTPVVFITSHTDREFQIRAAENGGNDFIGKPFLPIEISVKALTLAIRKRLDLGASGAG